MADNDAIDAYGSSSVGPVNNMVQRAFYGVDIRGTGSYLPVVNDNIGYVFFTRPRCNMSYGNLAMNRRFMPFTVRDPQSIEAAVRALLDPVSSRYQLTDQDPYPLTESHLVDQECAFIPILSNSLTRLSGWPEAVIDTATTPAGMRLETQSRPDGIVSMYGSYTLNASFKNVLGGGIQKLMQAYLLYISSVTIGEMQPYPDMIANSEFDFSTRIYRLTMDITRKYVREIAACGAAFPTVDTSPNNFNFNIETPISDEETEISYRFSCDGFIHNDPILIYDFNSVVSMFNPNMLETNADDDDADTVLAGMADGSIFRLDTDDLKNKYRHRAYPRINPRTMELEWYAANVEVIEP